MLPRLLSLVMSSEKVDSVSVGSATVDEDGGINLFALHEERAGRLIIDPK